MRRFQIPARKASVIAVVALLVVMAGCAGITSEVSDVGESFKDTEQNSSQATFHDGNATQNADIASASSGNGTLQVHQINVGQSLAVLIIGPSGETMLIDTGDYRDDGEHVLDYLKQHDINRLDYLVTSHADADHIGGHAAVIKYLEEHGNGVGAVYDPGYPSNSQTYQDYLDAVEKYNVTLYETRAGDTIPMTDARVNVLGPPERALADGERNENSIVLKVTHGQASFLFTGDGESAEEQYLVDTYGAALNATVLEAGHHGSKSSSGNTFLDDVHPKMGLISSAYDSQYDHPNQETLERFSSRSIPAYWTAIHGDVVLTSNGSAITVETQQSETTDPLKLKQGSRIEPSADADMKQQTVIDVGSESGATPRNGTATQTPMMTDGGSATTDATTTGDEDGSAPNVRVSNIEADPSGDDRTALNNEYVVLENTGSAPVNLTGWTIKDDASHTYTLSSLSLTTGDTVAVHTGTGADSANDVYWNSKTPIWNNGGDTVTVTDDDGNTVVTETY